MTQFLTELTNLQLIAVRGEKAMDLLQGQITCDMREITITQTRLSAHCSPKGRVLSTFRVIRFLDTIYLLTPTIMQDAVIQQLKKYAIFSKVVLEKAAHIKILGCVGHEIIKALNTFFTDLPQQPDQAITTKDLLIVRIQGNEPRYLIMGDSIATTALQQLIPSVPQSISQWQLLDIKAGIASIYPATSDQFTPQMLNYPALNAVSFTKGCYTGQEVIARTHYLGKAKRHVQQLIVHSDTLPIPGTALLDAQQQPAGIVLDAAQDNQGECRILAVVSDGNNTPPFSTH